MHPCFSQFQYDIDKSFIELFSSNYPEVRSASFSYWPSIHDQFTAILKFVLPLVLIFSTFYAVNNIIKVSDCACLIVISFDDCFPLFKHRMLQLNVKHS